MTATDLTVLDARRETANRARLLRAKIKADCRGVSMVEGMGIVSDVIERNDPLLGSWMLFKLLLLPRKMDEERVLSILREVGASPYVRLKDLTERQRREMRGAIRRSGSGHAEWLAQRERLFRVLAARSRATAAELVEELEWDKWEVGGKLGSLAREGRVASDGRRYGRVWWVTS